MGAHSSKPEAKMMLLLAQTLLSRFNRHVIATYIQNAYIGLGLE